VVEFFLVGSRFYGTNREDSDYDYIAEDTPEARQECIKLGLSRLESSPKVRYVGHGFDICLVKNVKKYVEARDQVAKLPNVTNLSKGERHFKLLRTLETLNGMV